MLSKMMITINNEKIRFKYRTVGIIRNESKEKILLHRFENETYWALPGGRVEFLETGEDTIKREILEEVGVYVKNAKLKYICENFFMYNQQEHHEMSLYYIIELVDINELLKKGKEFESEDGGIKLYFKWFNINEISDLDLKPVFLKEKLMEINDNSIEHIVERITK